MGESNKTAVYTQIRQKCKLPLKGAYKAILIIKTKLPFPSYAILFLV